MAIRKLYNIPDDPFLENQVMTTLKELDAPTPRFLDEIPMPSWASEENGCIPHKAIKVGNGIVVEYKPIKTLGVGYAKIYIVGKDGQPFPRMKEIWGEIHRVWSNEMKKQKPQTPMGGTIASTGEIRDQYGANAPSFEVLHGFLLNMNILYSNWKYFPNVKSYKKVGELTIALDDVRSMDVSADYIENNIKELREQIRSRQAEIAEMEKKMNDMYEKAADAMNLLEENGVKVDAKGKIEGIEEDGSEYISSRYFTGKPPWDCCIDVSSMTPYITPCNGHPPAALYKIEDEPYWSNGHGYSCATSGT